MKLLVCGPIAHGGIQQIRELQKLLKKKGFSVIDQFKKSEMDYSDVKDFRDKHALAEKIVKNDLKLVEECDVVVAICDKPSFGTAMEIYHAKKFGKKVVILNEHAQPSPWPVAFADYLAKSRQTLVETLLNLDF